MKKQALGAFVEAIAMFRDQVRMHDEFKTKAQPHEVQMLKANHDMLMDRLAQLEESKAHLEKSIRSKHTYIRTIERDISNLKPDLRQLKNRKDMCAK